MPTRPTLRHARPPFGRLIRPFAFDPVQLIIWDRAGSRRLRFETWVRGTLGVRSAVVDLDPATCAWLIAELRPIRERGFVGRWALGSGLRAMRFDFQGLARSGEAQGSLTWIAGLAYTCTPFTVRPDTFDALVRMLETFALKLPASPVPSAASGAGI